MKFSRLYSKAGTPVRDQVTWKRVEARIEDAKTGAVVFSQPDVEVPEAWSQTAANILAQKYFRKAGVPSETVHIRTQVDEAIPKWLWRSDATINSTLGSETSAHQVFHRLAGCWTYWGWRTGLFQPRDHDALPEGYTWGDQVDTYARIFYDELYMMLALQVAAPNSPQWFNTGLHWAYGIEGPDSGQWVVNRLSEPDINKMPAGGTYIGDGYYVERCANTYERPQPHACFLTSVADDLVNEGGIMDAWVREARIFKHGSGSGTNVSKLRAKGEPLSGGGVAGSIMSWLRIGDRAAGAIASGGITRKASTMRILDADHPEIFDFIRWKVREEAKAAAMYVGSKAIIDIGDNGSFDIPQIVIDRASAGFKSEIFGIDWEGEAIDTVSGQNSNNSIRVTAAFMRAVEEDGTWDLTARATGEVVRTVRAREIWDEACRAAWACADPGVMFADNVNAWNTCAADGEITTTNPCSEFVHLCGTPYGSSACNLASLRLTAFLLAPIKNAAWGTVEAVVLPNSEIIDLQELDLDAFEHACRLWTYVLEISVSMASFPAREFALGAYNYRTLGLGYADLGGLLARLDLRYDSKEGRSLAAALTALMTGVAYRTSAELAEALGPYPRFEANQESHRAVMEKHHEAAKLVDSVNNTITSSTIIRAIGVWNTVCRAQSFRNAQTTVLAPTGTISLIMDCRTSGIEPFLFRESVKNLAGGGTIEFSYAVRDEDTAMSLPTMAHVKMMAAVQPSLSGAISKTVNMPREARVFEVNEVYLAAYRLGLKSIAIYRDGSKLTQPMRAKESALKADAASVRAAGRSVGEPLQESSIGRVAPAPLSLTKGQERGMINTGLPQLVRGTNEHLPWRRERGYTQKAKIDGQSVFWRVSEYPDGRPGELFIELANEGSTLRATANCVAIAFSVALKHGTPLAAMVDKYLNTKFEPAGYVEGHERIRFATSYMDLIARDLAITYLGREDLANVVRPVAQGTLETAAVAFDKRALAAAGGLTGGTCRVCGGLMGMASRCPTCLTCGWNEGCG